MNNTRKRSMDAFDTLCRLYGGEQRAQALMKTRGACNPRVARLVRSMVSSRIAVFAAREYMSLPSLPEGYGRLMTACGGSREVAHMCALAGLGRRLSKWEIDKAVEVVLRLIDDINR